MSKNKQQVKFEADVSGFKTKIKEAENSITSLNNELKLNQTQLKGNKEDTNLLSQRIETLKQKYEEQGKVVENTKKAYEKAVEIFGENSKEAENLKNKLLQAQTAQQNIKNEIEKTNKQLKTQTDNLLTTGRAWQESGERLKDYGSKIESAGNKLSIVSGLLGGIAVASLKTSIDFESAFAGVIKTVDGTEEQLTELRQGILDMSTELPSSASEISAVAESAGQLGIQTENILDFTRVMIDLGNSTNVSAEEGAIALAKFANVTKMSAEEYSNLGSTIVALGNKYATTEADIISMGQNLASAGTQVGMSQSDIMALATALSSVGLEAQAGGTAFSKALVEMQLAVETNSKDLKDWADVAGMSTKEFAKLFKEDATSALQAFIKGLSECGEETKSAIKVLDDMGITETRMRDALLRSANASDTFTSAIELGSKAWDDNIALTEEAEKRYGTAKSQMEMLKNEAVKTATEFGDELAPSLREIVKDTKPVLKSISSAIEAFAKLDDSTKQNIIRIGALVVALGPAVKIGGNIIKTIGSVKTGIGTLTGAIGLMKNGIGDATGASANLEKGLQMAFSPTGIAVAAVVAGIGIVIGETNKATEETRKSVEASKELLQKIIEEKKATDDLRTSIDNNIQSDLEQIDATQRLWEELKKITDENGKIKKGYENRAKVITDDLSEALGTEISITDNVINKYKDLRTEIDNLILKKKGEAVLSGYEEKYNNSLNNRTQKTQELINAEEKLNNLQAERDTLYNNLSEIDKKSVDDPNAITYYTREELLNRDISATTNVKNKDIEIQNTTNAIKTLKDEINNYTKDEEAYWYASELIAEGSAESIQEVIDGVGKTHIENGKTIETTYKNQIIAQQKYLSEAKARNTEAEKNCNQTEKSKSQITINESNRRLITLTQELASMTSTTEENSEDIKNAWKQLATESYDIYAEEVSKIPIETRIKIEEMTGEVVRATPEFISSINTLAQNGVETLDKDEEFKMKAIKSLNGYLQGLTDEDKRNFIKQAGIENVESVMKELEKGDLSEQKGIEILKGLYSGLGDKDFLSSLYKRAGSISGQLASLFTIKSTVSTAASTVINKISSSIPGHKDGLEYVPYDNYIARLHKGERVLTAEENKAYTSNNIENKIATRNITVQFFPQSMSEDEIERAEKYIARKWGIAI